MSKKDSVTAKGSAKQSAGKVKSTAAGVSAANKSSKKSAAPSPNGALVPANTKPGEVN